MALGITDGFNYDVSRIASDANLELEAIERATWHSAGGYNLADINVGDGHAGGNSLSPIGQWSGRGTTIGWSITGDVHVAFWFKYTGNTVGGYFLTNNAFPNETTTNTGVYFDAINSRVFANTTEIMSGITNNVWHHIEIQWTSTTSTNFYIDGVLTATVTMGVTRSTFAGGDSFGLRSGFAGNKSDVAFDSFITSVDNGTGSHNGRIGMGDVILLSPTADNAGNTASFTGVTAGYQALDNTTSVLSEAVTTSNSGDVGDYTFEDVSTTSYGAVHRIRPTVMANNQNATLRDIQFRINGNNVGTAITPPQQVPNKDNIFTQTFDQDPVKAANWLLADVNAYSFGIAQVT